MSIGEELDEGKPHVQFCEGHSNSLTPIKVGDKERFRYAYSTIYALQVRGCLVLLAET